LVGGQLPAETRDRMRAEVRRRVIEPVLDHANGKDPEFFKTRHWWATADHNWNAVCTAGGVGAVLALVESPAERASAVAWAEVNLKRFLGGFAGDGYCSASNWSPRRQWPGSVARWRQWRGPRRPPCRRWRRPATHRSSCPTRAGPGGPERARQAVKQQSVRRNP
jgi:hypothetical protein